jgi:hypothetical protein
MPLVTDLSSHRARAARISRTCGRVVRVCACAFLLTNACVALILQPGCTTAPPGTPIVDEEQAKLPPKPRSPRVTASFGGTHRKALIERGVWYQSFENRLLFLDAPTGMELVDLELAPRGTTGVVSDFEVDGTRVFAVLEDDWVFELDASDVRNVRVVQQWGRWELGIAPHFVAVIENEVYVSGSGGVVRLSDAQPHRNLPPLPRDKDMPDPQRPVVYLEGKIVGRAVPAVGGPVACIGRRIHRIADGSYLGSASMLIPLPDAIGGGYGFALQASEGAQVGLMDANFRERAAGAMPGKVHAMRVFDDRFFAVNDFEVASWKLDAVEGDLTAPHTLGALLSIPVKGARDIAKLQRNRFAVAGSFGRALYRYLPEGDRPGDTFYWSRRLPGRLEVSATDRRRVLASSPEGAWLYLIGEEAEMSDRSIVAPDRPLAGVETAWGSALVDESRERVTIRMGDRAQVITPSRGGLVSGLAVADGRIWIGHDFGIDIVAYDPVLREVFSEERIRLTGPMVALYPNRVGGGVTYVARFGGFGVVRLVDVDAPPIASKGTRSAFDTSAPLSAQEER